MCWRRNGRKTFVLEKRWLARISHTPTATTRDKPASTSLRWLTVLDVLSSTPLRAERRAPRIHRLLTRFASPRCEKCGLGRRPGTIQQPEFLESRKRCGCGRSIHPHWHASLMNGWRAMNRNSGRRSKCSAATWMKTARMDVSSSCKHDRSAGRRSAWNDHESEKPLKMRRAKTGWLSWPPEALTL
jgi:hypothetical protein